MQPEKLPRTARVVRHRQRVELEGRYVRHGGPTVRSDEGFRAFQLKTHDAILVSQTSDHCRAVYQTPPPKPRNGAVHKPPTPTQGVLVLAESNVPYQVVNSKKPARTAKRLKHALR